MTKNESISSMLYGALPLPVLDSHAVQLCPVRTVAVFT